MVFATWRQCAPRLTHASLGPPESKSQTAPRSVQPFLGDRCKTLRPILSDRCLSVCQSVTLVYCGQTAGWIKMPLGVEVGLGPGHIVLDENPAPRKGAQQPPVFGPCLLWPNVDQDATRRHYLTWGPSSPRKGAQQPPLFGPCLLRPTGWMYQDSSWYGDRRRPRLHCVRWGRSSPTERGTAAPPSAHFYCGQTVAHILLSSCCTAHNRESLYFTTGTGRPFPLKIAPSYEGSGPPSNT